MPPVTGIHAYNCQRLRPDVPGRYRGRHPAADHRHQRPQVGLAGECADWPDSPGWGFPPGPEHLADWAAFLAAVASRYPQAAGIEIWNEPNHPTYWGRGYASHATPIPLTTPQLLRVAYYGGQVGRPLDAGDRRRLSNSAGHGPGRQGSRPSSSRRRCSRNGAAGYMDAISTHPYPQSGTVPAITPIFELGIDQMRAARATVGATTPIWLTEVGITTTGPGVQAVRVSETEQAAILADTFRWLGTQPDIEASSSTPSPSPPKTSGLRDGLRDHPRSHRTPSSRSRPSSPSRRRPPTDRPPLVAPSWLPRTHSRPRGPARVRVRATCNQDCTLTAGGSVFVTRKRRACRGSVRALLGRSPRAPRPAR